MLLLTQYHSFLPLVFYIHGAKATVNLFACGAQIRSFCSPTTPHSTYSIGPLISIRFHGGPTQQEMSPIYDPPS